MNEELLLQRAKLGDRSAREELLTRHYESLRRRYSEDVAQETVRISWEGIDQFEGRSTVKTWLHGTARNVGFAARRKDSRAVPGIGGDFDPFVFLKDRHRSPQEILIARERADRVSRAIAELPRDEREVVEPWLQGDRVAEIARRLQVTYSRAYTRLERALATLEARLPADL